MSVEATAKRAPASIEEARERVHCGWARVADSWSRHADYVDAQAAQITEKMLDLTRPQPGERVVELACGPGGSGLAAAPMVGPEGEVLMSDVVPGMTAIAAARAAGLGLRNVSTQVLDLERINLRAASYDVVLCRDGLMFAVEPASAASEIRRILRPGGRVALAVWGPPADNPWLGAVFDGVGAVIGATLPPPGLPGPFALDSAERLARLLSDAGLAEVAVHELRLRRRAESFQAWWSRTSALAGPLSAMLASLPPHVITAIRARLQDEVSPYATGEGLDFPALALIASGRVGA